jgi:hypothetical protein
MLKNAVILKRILILAMFSACLGWISFDNTKPVQAAAYVCCRDCNAMTEACAANCNNQTCIDKCLEQEETCFATCTNSVLLCP